MPLHTLGTDATTTLQCLPAWAANLAAADVAAIAQAITDDSAIAAILGGYGAGPSAMIGTGTTSASTSITSVARVSGAALASIQVGDLVLGDGVTAGTFVKVVAAGGATITLTQATTSNGAGVNLVFVRSPARPGIIMDGAQLVIPNRGILKILPGDIPAIDNIGWPILVSGASVNYAGSDWNFS